MPLLAVALAAPVLLAPSVSEAAGPAKKQAKLTKEEEAALAEARDLFEKGNAKYETFDYAGAIELWQLAYSKVPDVEAGVRNAMVYNIALAQEKAYDVDKDVAHLRQAVLLLEQWRKYFKAMYERTPETVAEVGRANKRIDELNRKIAIANGEEPAPEEPPAPESGDIEFDSGYEPTPEEIRESKKEAASDEAKKLIIAGYVVGGIGILFIAGGVGAFVTVPGPIGVGGGATMVGFGGAALVTGSVLLGVGYKRKKAVKAGDYSFAPMISPTTAGASMTVRF